MIRQRPPRTSDARPSTPIDEEDSVPKCLISISIVELNLGSTSARRGQRPVPQTPSAVTPHTSTQNNHNPKLLILGQEDGM